MAYREEGTVIHLENLVRPSIEVTGQIVAVKAEIPKCQDKFQNDNAPGPLRAVESWKEVAAIGAESGRRLRAALEKTE